MRKIIYERPDGGVTIVIPATSEEKAWERLPQEAINPRFVDDSEIPQDRTFRNAWKHDLTVDMPKAREIVRDHIRADRTQKLAALDIQFMRAVEDGDAAKQSSIVAQKQALRDAPANPAIESAKDAEELKAMIP